MDQRIENCRLFLVTQYAQLKGTEDFQFHDELIKGDLNPAWSSISFGNPHDPEDKTDGIPVTGGILLDPEIGFALIILPFEQKDDIAGQVNRALGLQSSLLPESNYTEIEADNWDKRGTWRVGINWLIDKNDFEYWLAAIKEIRRKTAHTEDIHLDSIVNRRQDWNLAFENHGFPRLLLKVRRILYKMNPEGVSDWLSADKYVEETLQALPAEMENQKQKLFANEVIKQIPRFLPSVNGGSNSGSPRKSISFKNLENIIVKGFRNLENVMINFGDSAVSSVVINGANGTGKSNLTEAISLALFNCSNRYVAFLADPDILGQDKERQYINNYLIRFNSSSDLPSIVVNDEPVNIELIADLGSAREVLRDKVMNGTLLTQEASSEFLSMSSDELNTTVLRGYSKLADGIIDYVGDQFKKANLERQDLLHQLGLYASIKRIDTAFHKVAKEQISAIEVRMSISLVGWLENLSNIVDLPQYSTAGQLASQWRAWGDGKAIEKLSKKLSGETKNTILEAILFEWLQDYNNLVEETRAYLEDITIGVPEHLPQITEQEIEHINIWGEWLASQAEKPSGDKSEDIGKVKNKILQLKTQQQEIISNGSKCRERLKHFSDIDNFLKLHWAVEHPEECPTCGTNLKSRDGVLKVVEALKSQTEKEQVAYRQEYKEVLEKIKACEVELVDLGQEEVPIAPEIQSELVESFQWLVPETSDFSGYISGGQNRKNLLTQIMAFRNIPSLSQKIEPKAVSTLIATALIDEFKRIEQVFSGPDNWEAVKIKIDKQLGLIIAEHLPDTLGGLWYEIALNLTPAAWLLPGRARFEVKTVRGTRKTSVRLGTDEKAPLAKYILNHAEIHVQGLSWFITKYLTTGRFEMPLICLDDPDQEMDQTTFRDLCRFLESLLRLHKVLDIPLTLLVTLHQEDRALDMARATNAKLNVLDWGKIQSRDSIHPIRLLGEGYHPVVPSSAQIMSSN